MSEKRVLVVDDEEDLTWSISKHLSKDKDKYMLITVNSANEALEVLAQFPVDLVISDIRMPEISGLDLLMEIKDNYPTTKVIIMTAYGSSEVQEEANRRGCFKYIEKPFEMKELRQLIMNAVEDKKGFDGRISDFQLSDLIQMNCLGRLTNALHVKHEEEEGIIFFEDGNIVHAQLGDKDGEDAFYQIISWEGGQFSVDRNVRAPKETIAKGWQTLLLEGLRRVDENRKGGLPPEETKQDARRENLAQLLSRFVKTKGIILAVVFDEEGLPVVSSSQEDHTEEYPVAQMVPLVSEINQYMAEFDKEIKMGTHEEISILFEKGLLQVSKITGRSEFLMVLADRSINPGLLRMEAKKIIKQVAAGLKP